MEGDVSFLAVIAYCPAGLCAGRQNYWKSQPPQPFFKGLLWLGIPDIVLPARAQPRRAVCVTVYEAGAFESDWTGRRTVLLAGGHVAL